MLSASSRSLFSRRVFLTRAAAATVAAFAGGGAVFATGNAIAAGAGTGAGALQLRVVSFNIRYKNANDARDGNGWDEVRRDAVAALVRRLAPDILGTQETLPAQRRDLEAALPEYGSAGVGRGAGGAGEQCAVFFKKSRFALCETRHFWISETPDRPPAADEKPAWGAAFTRIVTAVRLREKPAGGGGAGNGVTGGEFWFLNTHFDHISERARVKAGELVIARLKTFGGGALPVVLTGDFNCVAGVADSYKTLTGAGAFLDTWTLARERRNAGYNTFQAFSRTPRRRGRRIDWVLARSADGAPAPRVAATEIVIEKRPDGGFPSDHFPLLADLSFPR